MDHTATHRLRDIGDLMRYAALVSGADSADFGPHRMLPDDQRRVSQHYPDELLYALAKAFTTIRQAQDLDPLSPAIPVGGGIVFYFARKYDEAIAQFRQ